MSENEKPYVLHITWVYNVFKGIMHKQVANMLKKSVRRSQ